MTQLGALTLTKLTGLGEFWSMKMVIILILIIAVIALILITRNAAVPNSVKEARWQLKQDVKRRQRPLGFIFRGLFIVLILISLATHH